MDNYLPDPLSVNPKVTSDQPAWNNINHNIDRIQKERAIREKKHQDEQDAELADLNKGAGAIHEPDREELAQQRQKTIDLYTKAHNPKTPKAEAAQAMQQAKQEAFNFHINAKQSEKAAMNAYREINTVGKGVGTGVYDDKDLEYTMNYYSLPKSERDKTPYEPPMPADGTGVNDAYLKYAQKAMPPQVIDVYVKDKDGNAHKEQRVGWKESDVRKGTDNFMADQTKFTNRLKSEHQKSLPVGYVEPPEQNAKNFQDWGLSLLSTNGKGVIIPDDMTVAQAGRLTKVGNTAAPAPKPTAAERNANVPKFDTSISVQPIDKVFLKKDQIMNEDGSQTSAVNLIGNYKGDAVTVTYIPKGGLKTDSPILPYKDSKGNIINGRLAQGVGAKSKDGKLAVYGKIDVYDNTNSANPSSTVIVPMTPDNVETAKQATGGKDILTDVGGAFKKHGFTLSTPKAAPKASKPTFTKADLQKKADAAGYSYDEYYNLVKDKITLK